MNSGVSVIVGVSVGVSDGVGVSVGVPVAVGLSVGVGVDRAPITSGEETGERRPDSSTTITA